MTVTTTIAELGRVFEDADTTTCDAALEAWQAAVVAAVRDAIPGCTIDVDYDGISQYIAVAASGRQSVDVRLSTHRQRYGGIAWSFETSNTAQQIEMGLRIVAKAANEADEIED